MSETPVPRPARPGIVQLAIIALLTCMFIVKAGGWWLAIYEGTTTIDDMSTWAWVKVGFYHVAVVAGVVGIVEMLRDRARPASAEPTDGHDSPERGR